LANRVIEIIFALHCFAHETYHGKGVPTECDDKCINYDFCSDVADVVGKELEKEWQKLQGSGH